jgi:nicotinamidase-related amidase
MITDRKGQQLNLPERLDPARTALLIVDVQNDFIESDGVCGKEGNDLSSARPMIERLRDLIECARKTEVLIVYIQAIYDEPALGRPLAEQYARRGFHNSMCLSGTSGAEFVAEVTPSGLPNEIVVKKHRFSPFGGSDIDLVLRSNGIKTVVITGIVTEVCVESTARDAFFRDYYVVEASDCVSSYSAERDAASKTALLRSFGRIVPSDEISAVWLQAGAGPRNWHAQAKRERLLTTLDQRVDPAHTALILIGLQNDFSHENGAMARRGAAIMGVRNAAAQALGLLRAAREAGVMIIHVQADYACAYQHVGFPGVHSDKPGNRESGELCQSGSWGAQFIDGAEPVGDEQVVTAHRYSGFVDTRLDLLLRSNDIRTIIVAGVSTNCEVDSTAREAAMRDYYLVIAADCVAADDAVAHLHAASLETIRRHFGLVVSRQEILNVWGAHEPWRRYSQPPETCPPGASEARE